MTSAYFNRPFFFLLVILTIISCKKSNKTDSLPDADIYIAGAFPSFAGSISAVGYWKNGIEVKLNDSLSGLTNAITVKGTDVYAVGYTYKTGNGDYGLSGNDSLNQQPAKTGTYWHNGITTTVGINTVCTAIAVSGNDVYVAGYAYTPIANNNGGFSQSPNTENLTGMYWKNGTPVTLGPNTICTSIAVIGSDVYVAGAVRNMAAYWKNGVLNNLPGNVLSSVANAVASDGSNIYFAGTVYASETDNYAVYWKNGVIGKLASDESTANAITINNGDLYIGGSLGATAAFWKNGAVTTLQYPQLGQSGAQAIALYNNAVYVAGYFVLSAVYWQNGTPLQLAFAGTANGIAVVPK